MATANAAMSVSPAYASYGALAVDTLQPTASQHAVTIIFAPCVVGWLLSVFLTGYALSFSLTYFARTSVVGPEPRRVRMVLVAVMLLTLASAVIHCIEIGHYMLTQRRSFEYFQGFHWSDAVAPLPQALGQGLVQFLLAVRALSLVQSRTWRITLGFIIHSLTLAALAFAIVMVIAGFMLMYGVADPLPPLGVSLAGSAWYILSSLVDLAILVLLLIQFRRRLAASSPSPIFNNAHSRADYVFKRLMRLSLFTWATTAFLTIGTAIGGILTHNNLYYDVPIAFGAPLAPLYALSLFTTLHAREGLRNLLRPDSPEALDAPAIRPALPRSGSSKRFNLNHSLQIRRPSYMSRATNSTVGTILDAQGFPVGTGQRRASVPRLPSMTGLSGGVTVVQTVTVEPWRPHLAPSEDELTDRPPQPPIHEVDLR